LRVAFTRNGVESPSGCGDQSHLLDNAFTPILKQV